MTKQEAFDLARQYAQLQALGLSWDEADQLRKISRTLRLWFERECGDGNSYGSWAIERDGDDGDGRPYLVHHHYRHGNGKDYVTKTPIADREAGARKRLAAIMARHPELTVYVQSDPRGCALYVLTSEQVANAGEHGIDSIYNRGLAVA